MFIISAITNYLARAQRRRNELKWQRRFALRRNYFRQQQTRWDNIHWER